MVKLQATLEQVSQMWGLESLLGIPLTHLSQGNLQRLCIAQAFLGPPDFIFLDEPTAGLDVMAAATIRDDITNMAREEGMTFLRESALAKARDGVTTLREINKVTFIEG